MFSGGNVVITVADLDAAATFYSQRLGLRLTHRFGNRWVAVDAGPSYYSSEGAGAGLVLGLQPPATAYPAPGTRGAIRVGFETGRSLERLVAQCSARGVPFTGDVISFEGGKCIAFDDVEGNPTYLWEVTEDMLPEEERTTVADGDSAAPSIAGGHAVVFVADMDRAVRYYSEVLGLPLTFRYADKIATVEAGRRLVIFLHPTSPQYPPPGTKGALRIALHVDEPIDRVVSRLAARGVRLATGAGSGNERASTIIEDMDGNPIELVEEGALFRQEQQEATTARR